MTSIIPGLSLHCDILRPELEKLALDYIDSQLWSTEIRRRTQHYGYHYSYRGGASLTPTTPIGGFLLVLSNYLAQHHIMEMPTQCIVNEYRRDQGIAAHIDRNCFGPVIATFSIGENTNMIFRSKELKREHNIILPRGSLLVLKGEARYRWTHEIPKNTYLWSMSDCHQEKSSNYRRVSITYRTVA